MRRRLALLLGAAALLGSGGLALGRPWASAAVVRVEPGVVEERLVARALIEAAGGVAKVRAQADGRVLAVHVREGARVRAGDVLAEIDPAPLAADVERGAAEVATAEATLRATEEGVRREERAVYAAEAAAARAALALARSRAERHRAMRRGGTNSAADLDEAERELAIAEARAGVADARERLAGAGGRVEDVAAARARVSAARAALDRARHELTHARIVAPIDGIILERRIDPGDTLGGARAGPGGPTLFEIADPGAFEARIEVEDGDAGRLALGQAVQLVPEDGGRPVATGRVIRVGARLERRAIGVGDLRIRADTRVRPAWTSIEGARTEDLLIGRKLEAIVVLARREVPAAVPREAVQVRDGRAVVAARWGPFSREVRVSLGIADERLVEVHGIAVGTALVLPAR